MIGKSELNNVNNLQGPVQFIERVPGDFGRDMRHEDDLALVSEFPVAPPHSNYKKNKK